MQKLFTAALVSAALVAAAQSRTTTAITNVTVIDVDAGRDIPSQTVVIDGDRIDSVGPTKAARVPRGATVVDGTGKFLIPGLWDMHGHLFSNSGKAGADMHAWYYPLYVAAGVTGIRDMWTNLDEIPLVKQWNADAEAGKLLGPRVMFTGPMINGNDGGLRNVIVVMTPDEARRVVDTVKDGGGAAMKIHSRLPHDAYIALAARARERQIPVIGHLPASVTAREAITAGQHSIEHNPLSDGCASEAAETEAMAMRERRPVPAQVQQIILDAYDQQRCEDLMRRLHDAGVWQVPTLVEARSRLLAEPSRTMRDELKYVPKAERDGWVGPRPTPKDRGDGAAELLAQTRPRVFQQMQKLVGMMQRFGVPLMTGTDVSNPWVIPGFSVHDELALFVGSGLTPAEALRAATLAPARYLGKTDTLGTVAKGKLADLVLLDANPLADIHNTLKIRSVMVGGRYLDRAALDAQLAGLAGK
jgi:imidazolonepropionase-like amidohydrolase